MELLAVMVGLFLVTWVYSFLFLRLAKINRVVYSIAHPVVTMIFGTMMLAIFFFSTLIIFAYSTKKVPNSAICHLIVGVGLAVGILVIAKIYLIDEENKQFQGWIYFISIVCGLPIAILEFLHGFELFSFWMSSVPLMYLGTRIGVWYLQKRRINRWREEGLKT